METWKKQVKDIDNSIITLQQNRSIIRSKITQKKLSKFLKRGFSVTQHIIELLDEIPESKISVTIPSLNCIVNITLDTSNTIYECILGGERYVIANCDHCCKESQEVMSVFPEFCKVFMDDFTLWSELD